MARITREEILKIAQMSSIELHEDEMDGMLYKLQAVLTYAERVAEVATVVDESPTRQINVFREDYINATDPGPLLQQAPEREENYFVVPKVLANN